MPIDVKCDSCQKRLRVPDKAAGKKIKCPGCESIILVPAGDEEPTISITPQKKSATPQKKQAAKQRDSGSGRKVVDKWVVKTEDGENYGPIDRAELDEWVVEERLTGDCQVLKEGSEQWQWASDLYPELDEDAAADDAAEEPAEDNPFAIGEPSTGSSGSISIGSDEGRVAKKSKKSSRAASAPVDDSEPSPRDRLGAGLLGIFAGAWGVHSFYLGKKNRGIVQILVTSFTCGLGAWWGIIEGIMILTGKIDRDAQGRRLRE